MFDWLVTGNWGISLAPWCAAPGQAVPAPLDLLGDDPSAFRYPQILYWRRKCDSKASRASSGRCFSSTPSVTRLR